MARGGGKAGPGGCWLPPRNLPAASNVQPIRFLGKTSGIIAPALPEVNRGGIRAGVSRAVMAGAEESRVERPCFPTLSPSPATRAVDFGWRRRLHRWSILPLPGGLETLEKDSSPPRGQELPLGKAISRPLRREGLRLVHWFFKPGTGPSRSLNMGRIDPDILTGSPCSGCIGILFQGLSLHFRTPSSKMRSMKKRWILYVLAAVAAAIAGYFLINGRGESPAHPVVLIGLDGADWHIMDPLMEQGKLPHLAKLREAGTWGVLRTDRPTKSPVIWTSIATGMTMIKHGILDYRFINENHIEIPYSAGERRAKTFWNILSEEGFTVGVINWFVTFPAEKVNGYFVSDRFRIGVYKYLEEEKVTYPEELKDKIFPLVVMFHDRQYKRILREEGLKDYWSLSQEQGIPVPEGRERQVKNFRIYTLQDKSIENVSLYLLEKVPVDLFATYFRLIDTTSHFTSIFIDEDLREEWIKENEISGKPGPETEEKLYRNMAAVLEPVYAYLDNVVGRIVEKAPEDAVFVIVSDHGFTFSSKGYGHYNTPIVPHGILILNGPGVKSGFQLEGASIYDITPTLLWLFGLPLGRDMDGKVLLDAFQEDFRKGRKVRTIPTYGMPSGREEGKKPRALDKEVLEDLRSLGYIK